MPETLECANSTRSPHRGNRGGHERPLTGVKEEREISLKRKKTISLSSSSLVAPDVAVTGACVCSQDAARLGVGTQIRPAWGALQRLAAFQRGGEGGAAAARQGDARAAAEDDEVVA